MPKKLELNASIEIVQEALGANTRKRELHPKATLSDFLPTAAERESFQKTVSHFVRQRSFDIDLRAIPIHPHTTLGEIIHALTFSALPGEPYIPKPDDVPPAPPAPEGTKPGMENAISRHEEEEIG
jgi:hypothetical protein